MRQVKPLAMEGGEPAIKEPLPPMYPGGLRIGWEEEQAVLEVLRERRLFRYYGPKPGPSKVAELEQAFSQYMGTRYAVAVTSGTAALMCGLAALGVGPGDEVIIPAYTWIATASAVVAIGAVPIIADVDESLTLDPADVEAKITPYTRAIIPVHMRGLPCQMDTLSELARRRGLKVLEDTAQATGASFQKRRLGTWGDVGAFSLQFNKIITSGEGGIVITDDETLYRRVQMYQDVVGGLRNNIPAEQILPGVNFRMPELLGAVALVQLRRLDALLAAMRARKAWLLESLAPLMNGKGITFPPVRDPEGDAAIALILTMPTAELAQATSRALSAEGVPSYTLYVPEAVDYHIYPHWAPIVNKRAWSPQAGPWKTHPRPVEYTPDMCPRSLELLGRAVHLDVSPELTNSQMEEICDAVEKVIYTLA